jgi:putative hemolysin
MSLVSSKDIAKVLKLHKLGFFGTFIGWFLLKILRIDGVNIVYDSVKHLEGKAFFEGLFEKFHLKVEFQEEELKRIPKQGPFITISNHPLGGADGIILLKILTEIRPDFKITGNFLLTKVKPIAPYIIAVNPFEDRKDLNRTMGGAQLSREHLAAGHALGFFPAGEVSTVKENNIYMDRPWSKGAIKIIQQAGVPVIPIYFHTRNSRFFYLLAKISGIFRTAKLPSELLNKANKPIKLRIGKAIQLSELEQHESIEELTQYLRQKTYLLANAFQVKQNPLEQAKEKLKLPEKPPKPIVKAIEKEKIVHEIEFLRNSNKRFLSLKNYEIYFTKTKDIPNILMEIGRLREITFREVGEGTNNPIDLDKFDNYYYHLFLWDTESELIAGAYRMGLGHEIFPKYGIKGFYINSLFKFEPELNKMMLESIEMGRAFVIKEYQQKPMPLFLLWKGIIHVTLRYPENKYLIGGVSISNQFSNFSKSLMIEFMKSHYYDPFVAQYINPKKEYKVRLKDADKDFVFDEAQADMNKFDKLITEIEPEGLRIPVLIKKYVKQNARLVAFNVDPKFNNAIDGLMYIKIADLPESTVKPVLDEYQAELLQNLEEKQL